MRSSVGPWVFTIVFSGKRGHFFWCVVVLFLGFSPSCFLDNEGIFYHFLVVGLWWVSMVHNSVGGGMLESHCIAFLEVRYTVFNPLMDRNKL